MRVFGSTVATVLYLIFAGLAVAAVGATQGDKSGEKPANFNDDEAVRKLFASWNIPFKPFRIIGNIHYVGVSGISSFLITTPEGHILIDSGFESTVPLIRDSVEKLGFRFADIKILLSSHAHVDHVGGHALMKQLTGAEIVMSETDADLLASGGSKDFLFKSEMMRFKPAKADRIVRDGDAVNLGGTKLICHLTPGHTKGCTTWTMKMSTDGKIHDVMFFGSTSINPGTKLVNNENYPGIASDLAATYKKLKAMPCNIFLAPHGSFFQLTEKARRLECGEEPNPFLDSRIFPAFLEQAERTFQAQLAVEKK